MKKQKITSKDLQVLLLREMAEHVKDNPKLREELTKKALKRLKDRHVGA